MIPNGKISLVIIDTYQKREFLRYMVDQTLQHFCPRNIYTLSHSPLIAGEIFLRINDVKSQSDYSKTVFNILPNIVKDEFFLIVQWDSCIVNYSLWKEYFLNYDYIGAPWPHHFPDYDVGNGGFSLRTRKLLENFHRCMPVSLESAETEEPEDLKICRSYRQTLEYHGVQFAPRHVASEFSYESGSFHESFGFHSPRNFPRFVNPQAIIEHSQEIASRIHDYRETTSLILSCLKFGYADAAVSLLQHATNRIQVDRLLMSILSHNVKY